MIYPDLPAVLACRFPKYRALLDATGRSGNSVLFLNAQSHPPLVAKRFSDEAACRKEADKLNWLRGRNICAPVVVCVIVTDDESWLIMQRLPGRDARFSVTPSETKVLLIANALRKLHSLDIRSCPFDATLAVGLTTAQANVVNGVVDKEDFDQDHLGATSEELFEKLLASRPAAEDAVVTHGDASLANFMIQSDEFAGFVDCGKLGVSDRYRDIAIICRSICFEVGRRWVPVFLKEYGIVSADKKRLYFYRLLDEFF